MFIALASSSIPPTKHYPWLPFHSIKYTPSSITVHVYTPKPHALSLFSHGSYNYNKVGKRRRRTVVKASRRESPYEVLGVSSSSTPDQIKRAYRKLALKYHPDVNEEADAQEKFMRIKHAYNMLLYSKSKKKYEIGSQSSGYNTARRNQSRTAEQEEEFYGFGDFFRDLQEEFQNWEANVPYQGKPKSLWEELAEIGEEFVVFLEKELNITDADVEDENKETFPNASYGTKQPGTGETGRDEGTSLEDNIDEIEAALTKLKKELGF